MKSDIRQPFKVIRAKQKDVAVRDQGEIKTITKEIDNLQKELAKAETDEAKAEIMPGIQAKEEVLRQLLQSRKKAVKVIKDTKSAIWQAVKKEEASNLEALQALNIVMKRSAQFADRAFRAGEKNIVEQHKELLEFAKQELPEEYTLLKRAATKIVKARTPSEIAKVTTAVEKMLSQYEKNQAVKQVKQAIKTARKAKLRPEFQKMLDGLEGISLRTSREETINRMKQLISEAEKDEHQVGDIPERLIEKANQVLADTTKPTLGDFSKGELELLSNTINSVIHQNVLKNKLIAYKTKRTRDDILTNTKDFIAKVWGTKHELSPSEIKESFLDEKVGDIMRWFKKLALTGQLSYDRMCEMIMGRNSDAYNITYKDLQLATNKEIDINKDFADVLKKEGLSREDIKNSMKRGKNIEIKLKNAVNKNGQKVESITLKEGELFDIAKLVMDPDNRAEILRNQMEGLRLHRQGKKGHSFSIDKTDLKTILDAVPEKMKKFLKIWHAYTNGRYEGSKYNISKEVAEEWLKEHGFPLKQKWDWSTRERYKEAMETRKHDPMARFVQSYLEDMGIFQKRAQSNAPFVIRNGYARMISQVSHMANYAAKATALNDAYSVLYDRSFRESVSKAFKDGEQLLRFMEDRLTQYQGRKFLDLDVLSEVLKKFAPRMHVGALAAKPYIMLYQPASLINAMSEIAGKYIFNPLHLSPLKTRKMQKQLSEDSPVLRARYEASGAQIMNPVQAENALTSYFGFEKKRLWGIHKMDALAINLLGLASDAEGKAKGLSGKALREYTARRTEEIVNRSQPTWDPLTISQLAGEGRDRPLLHQFVMFSSQRSKNTNAVASEFIDYIQKSRLAESKAERTKIKMKHGAKIAKTLALSQFAQSAMIWGLRMAYFAGLTAAATAIFKLPKKEQEKKGIDMALDYTGQVLGLSLIHISEPTRPY